MINAHTGDEKTKAAPSFQDCAASNVSLQLQSTIDVEILKSRSTSTETQQEKCLALLRLGPQTSYSLRANGIAQCAARIFELRAMGHIITTDRVKAIDSDSFVHVGAARYILVKEAQAQMPLNEVQ